MASAGLHGFGSITGDGDMRLVQWSDLEGCLVGVGWLDRTRTSGRTFLKSWQKGGKTSRLGRDERSRLLAGANYDDSLHQDARIPL